MLQVSPVAFYLLATLAVGPLGSASDYFPLHVGNQWVYKQSGATGGEPVVVQVLEAELIAEKQYFLVAGLTPSAAWLRVSEDGILSSLDRVSGRETVWAVFASGEGRTYSTQMHPCSPVARVDSVSARVQVPAGTFENALSISYPSPSCADAGLESDYFVPSVGLVQRTMTTFAGPLTLSLIYARIADTTVLSQPEVAFGLSLDQSVYSPRLDVPVLTARMTLRVRQPEPLELLFPHAQRFELIIKNEQGEEVYRWSDGRAFALLFGVERFGPGERNWMAEVPLRTKDGNQLPPGKYTAECWLTTVDERRYAAAVGFEIAAWREPVARLSGNWIFEAETSEGLLRARLALEEDGEKLAATLWIDNHVLKGEGETDGTQFEVLVVHADGSGPGHTERLRLAGRLDDDKITGSFDNGIDRGSWTGRRE
ncbi:MAG: hypothetical protein HY649_07825 [Acidobacteria bacterium]|nr:hypothetical protein [Acidobacteriota bacterium]